MAPVGGGELVAVFLRIGMLSFGGPAAQIALMHRMLVEERAWLSERQFLNALSFCMLLPGPEAMQLATFAGWRLRGVAGGLMAGALFVLPGALVIFALAAIYTFHGDTPLLGAAFLGIKAAVLAIVIDALLRVAARALRRTDRRIIALLAFAGIFLLALPYPLIVVLAGLYGAIFAAHGDGTPPPSGTGPSPASTALVLVLGLTVWLTPLVAVHLVTGGTLLGELGIFFAKLAVVTFGGAYAVLAYMAQDIVTGFGWLTAEEMIDGLGLAETTPGPLILVTQFVGYLAAFREGGTGMAVMGGLVALWATFVPCFVWIFAGAPHVDRIAAQPRLNGALQAITAAVVGVILNLSVWFGLHVLFGTVSRIESGPLILWIPDPATLDGQAVLLAALSALLLLRFRWPVGGVLAVSAVLALALSAI